MNKRFHKRALSVTAAMLTLTSAVATVNAAQRNEITLKSSADSAAGGETFEITLGYEPDSTGASGFTVDLHYDPEAISLNVEQSAEYVPSGGFAIVTNFDAAEGTVRVVGANLTGDNVTEDTELARLSFTVNEGASGDIDFWTEVDTLVAADGEDFINVDYHAYGPYDPFTVAGPADSQSDETSSAEETTTTETETEPEYSTPDETVTSEAEQTTESESEPEQSLPEEYVPPQTQAPEETAPTEMPSERPDGSRSEDSGALFVHTQGDSDYNNEEALQYAFSPYDYITETDQTVDISVEISSTGSAQGGIGMLTSEGWTIYGCSTDGDSDGGSEIWTANAVDLGDVLGDIAVQLYYLKNNSEFKVKSVSIKPTANDTDTSDEPQTTEPQVTEPAVTEPTADEIVTQQPAVTEAPVTEMTVSETQTSETTDLPTERTDAPNTEVSSPEAEETPAMTDTSAAADGGQTTEQPQTTSSAQVENAVSNASAKADGNPDTGNGIGKYICGGIMLLCGGQISYSIYALTKKTQE